MRPDTILVPTRCDLKRFPLDAREVFLLSRLDGQLTLEEIGEITGLGFDEAQRVAEKLVSLGVAKPVGAPDPPVDPPKGAPPPRKSSKRLRRSQKIAAVEARPDSPAPPDEREKVQRLQAAAKMLAGHTRANALVQAGDDAVRSGDIIGAANNYRLALQMHDDPIIKEKLAAVDRHSRDLRYEKHVVKARAAERAERWDEAADHYVRATEARKEASVAERAANALRLAKGDLRKATTLAELAVAQNESNAEYRVTLAEVLLAAKLVVRAKEECRQALDLAPSNPRAQALAAALKKA